MSSCLLPVMTQGCNAFCYSSLVYKFSWIKQKVVSKMIQKILGWKIFKRMTITCLVGVVFLIWLYKEIFTKLYGKKCLDPKDTQKRKRKKENKNQYKIQVKFEEKKLSIVHVKKKLIFFSFVKKMWGLLEKKTSRPQPKKRKKKQS